MALAWVDGELVSKGMMVYEAPTQHFLDFEPRAFTYSTTQEAPHTLFGCGYSKSTAAAASL